ncbi:MAG: hypothetical protein AUG51_11660 [Acidobacteria bacterium 13_1_20CM_3_53_8]|nr:MAG: hypothetical protein AUG51_11660 [Acidobacteria bacterium 13_1_20CM_3_53_8]
MYVALTLALALACVAATQFFYLMFMQRMSRQDRKRIEYLEKELKRARIELETTMHELEIAERQVSELREEDDTWPEIIDG